MSGFEQVVTVAHSYHVFVQLSRHRSENGFCPPIRFIANPFDSQVVTVSQAKNFDAGRSRCRIMPDLYQEIYHKKKRITPMRSIERSQFDDTTTILFQPPTRHRVAARRRLLALGAVVLVALLGYFAVGAYIATQLTQPERQAQSATPADFGLPFEETTVRARDGLALDGWFIPVAGSDLALVLVPGRGACGRR